MNKSQVTIRNLQTTTCGTKHLSLNMPQEQVSDVLVLDARERQALATVRSLGSRGLRVAALDTGNDAPAFASRWCQRKIVCPAEEGTEAYLAFLEQTLEQSGVRVVIPCSNTTISLLRQHRERLEPRVRIALAKETALEIVANKECTLEIARQLGLDVPYGVTVQDSSQIDAALREVGLPAVVKSVELWAANPQRDRRLTSLLVATRDEAYRAVETLLVHAGSSVLFQQFLPGERESMSFLYVQGQFIAKFAHAIKRTYPPLGGTDVLRRSIVIPLDISEQAECLVRAIDLEGYCTVKFRRDRTGRPCLMEINPRLSAGIELMIASGIDFPYLLYQWASGEQIDTVEHYKVNCRMRYLPGDIATTAIAIQQAGESGITPPLLAILDFCLSFFIPMRYDYFDWCDLWPVGQAAIGWFRALPMWIRRAFTWKGTIDGWEA